MLSAQVCWCGFVYRCGPFPDLHPLFVVASCVDSEYASGRVEKVEKRYQPTALAYSLPLPELVARGEISLAFHSVLYTRLNMEGSGGLGTRLEKW